MRGVRRHATGMDGSTDRFPHGIPWLVKELDTMGFSLGLYGNAAARTCAGYPGQLGHEYVDAQTIADWGVRAWKYAIVGTSMAR